MGDQPADGTINPDNFNRLNGAYQRALHMLTPEQRAELRAARPDAPDYAPPAPQPDPEPEQQPQQWEPGTRLVVGDDGNLAEYEPPTPQRPNEQNRIASPWDSKYERKPVEERTSSGWPT